MGPIVGQLLSSLATGIGIYVANGVVSFVVGAAVYVGFNFMFGRFLDKCYLFNYDK